ncbi:MAG: Undecaprenyl-diphosphatase [Cytophagales bacterium]|jgi:undecaprenyl-diphosphatase|nr:undecaprenyl-diphosphate phosphatase [Bacteroidota bacterium]MBS1981638.1 undecaprenyl-diphosphate phosphatase [Bacteroidota bacterium]WHZ08948.1 MAG: Undecaprenyl-diphosphatase [Cytophagales bacterium]
MSVFEAIVLAVVEGITEFLPVSSTGHMIIVSSFMGIASEPFTKTYIVAVQLGAILSVLVLYWKKFLQSVNFYIKLFIAFLPAAIIGFILNDYIDALLERVEVVALMLIIGGVVFLFLDKIFNTTNSSDQEPTPISSLKIGLFQCIAMIPGVSRSAATIIGGLAQKLSAKTAAEFSFFLAVPTMFAATAYKLYKYYKLGSTFTQSEVYNLAVGNLVAFVVAVLAIKSLMFVISKYGFKVFGYYRIIIGVVILILFYSGKSLTVF